MKKLLFFIILCSLFSCSTETQEEQSAVTGKNFALSLYSTDSIYQSGIDSLFLFYFPESSTPVKPIYFQQELGRSGCIPGSGAGTLHLYYDSLFGFSRRVERSYGLLSGLHRDRKTRKYIR